MQEAVTGETLARWLGVSSRSVTQVAARGIEKAGAVSTLRRVSALTPNIFARWRMAARKPMVRALGGLG